MCLMMSVVSMDGLRTDSAVDIDVDGASPAANAGGTAAAASAGAAIDTAVELPDRCADAAPRP